MSEYTTDQILDMIEKLGDPSKLDLSGKDLSGIDLSRDTIQEKYKSRGWPKAVKDPPWYAPFLLKVALPGGSFSGAVVLEVNLPDLEETNLQGAHLNGANLQGARLSEANLEGASLSEANLQGTNLSEANLLGAFLWEANLRDAWLSRANLQDASLSRANLQGADLREANLQGAYLTGANLQGVEIFVTHLQGAYFGEANLQEVNLDEAKSLEGAYFAGARLHLTHLRREQIKEVGEERDRDYEAARRAYLSLKVNFKEIGYYDDARWAYLKERRMERKSHPWYSPYWFLSWIENIFTGYMERIWIIVLWLAIWPLLFAFLYWQVGGITNILGNPPPPISPLDYLFFSLRTMVTLAYSDFTPVGAGQWLAPLEGALGIAFFALLAFSVAKRITRD